MNIAEILKKCPKGTKLYSCLKGECELNDVPDTHIWIRWMSDLTLTRLNSEGKLYEEGECLLFPSKDQRDWSKFVALREDLKKILHAYALTF